MTDVWQPTPQRKTILNLPSTVELATPNVYADQIEWMCRHLARRDSVICRCTRTTTAAAAIASAELALMAGAERVEGCLFGNGERTGNVCLVTLGLNLFTQGVDPGIDFSDIHAGDPHRRVLQPAAGRPAPSVRRRARVHRVLGSHQDAIKKGLAGARAGARARQCRVGRALPADRSGRHRPHLRRGDPREQPVGQGRHRLPARARLRAVAAAPAADRVQPGDPADHRRDRQGAVGGRDPRRVRSRVRRRDDAAALPRPSHAAQRGDGTVERMVARLAVDGAEVELDRRRQRAGRRVRACAARRRRASTSTCRTTTSTASAAARTRRRSPTSSCASAATGRSTASASIRTSSPRRCARS